MSITTITPTSSPQWERSITIAISQIPRIVSSDLLTIIIITNLPWHHHHHHCEPHNAIAEVIYDCYYRESCLQTSRLSSLSIVYYWLVVSSIGFLLHLTYMNMIMPIRRNFGVMQKFVNYCRVVSCGFGC